MTLKQKTMRPLLFVSTLFFQLSNDCITLLAQDPLPNITFKETSIKSPQLASSADLNKWNRITGLQMGIDGNEFYGPEAIGKAIAYSSGLASHVREWFPVDGFKRTVCGIVTEYFETDDKIHNDFLLDHDINIELEPLIGYKDFVNVLLRPTSLANEFEPLPGATTVKNTGDRVLKHESLTAEIEPAFDRRYFHPETGYLSIEGNRTCVYGPWVWDRRLNDDNIEIHPAEQIWQGYGNERLTLVTVADASKRFNDRNDFYTPTYYASNYNLIRPWSATPLKSLFAVAFEIKPGDPPLYLSISGTPTGSVIKPKDGTGYKLTINGKPAIYVYEGKTENDFLKVTFESIRKRPDGSVIGYVMLRSTLLSIGELFIEVYKVTRLSNSFRYSIKSIRRLHANSIKHANKNYPPESAQSSYNEEFVKVEMSTSAKNKTTTTVIIPVGESVELKNFGLNVIGNAFEASDAPRINFTDSAGKLIDIFQFSDSPIPVQDNNPNDNLETFKIKRSFPIKSPGHSNTFYNLSEEILEFVLETAKINPVAVQPNTNTGKNK